MSKSKKRERVLVFESLLLKAQPVFPGVTDKPCVKQWLEEDVLEWAKFRLRDAVEEDSNFVQLIPYVVIRNSRHEIFSYRRSSTLGDSRLRGLWSVGVGGHINPRDDQEGRENILELASWRDLEEELKFFPVVPKYSRAPEYVGAIYLGDTPVNRTHFGVVLTVTYDGVLSPVGEEIEECRWSKLKNLDVESLEPWSRAIVTGVLRTPGRRPSERLGG